MASPRIPDLINPLLVALHQLGGSATLEEQEKTVAQNLKLSDSDLSEIHKGDRTKFSYNLAWARTNLKRYGLIENSSRGVWALNTQGQKTKSVDGKAVWKQIQEEDRIARGKNKTSEPSSTETLDEEQAWEYEALETVKKISPEAFERLCQRILRESGFVQVEVTGRSGDGGVDGKGILKLGEILSFHVIFQCKRFRGSVSPSVIRDFRGTMDGRADKGIIITTGTFTRDARAEALRDGATPIDLIDGNLLVLMLKKFGLGISVKARVVEDIVIDKTWFQNF